VDFADCQKCSRIVHYLDTIIPRSGLKKDDYWSQPVPAFGDPGARICLIGLAPGAHGANCTGRPFTGDGAGDFMYPLLYEAGLSSQPSSQYRGDGLELKDLYITNAVKCVPPENKPTAEEFRQCRHWLIQELPRLKNLRVVILLGQGCFTSYFHMLRDMGVPLKMKDYRFSHAGVFRPACGPAVLACYHTSRYNVNTGRMTKDLFMALLHSASELAASEPVADWR